MNQRLDTIDRHFVPVKRLELAISILFWINAGFSVSTLFYANFPVIKPIANALFILFTILYFSLSLILSLKVLPQAQDYRSTHLMTDAFAVPLDTEQTNLYYNNDEQPSAIRLAINIFENTLFSWRVTQHMLRKERAKIVLFGMIWFVLILLQASTDLTVVITQFVFATSLVSDYASLESARSRFKGVFKESWTFFQTGKPKLTKSNVAVIFNRSRSYESILSSMKVSLDSKIFTKINPQITAEWEQIKRSLKL